MGCTTSRPTSLERFQTVLMVPCPLKAFVSGRKIDLSQLELHGVIGVGTFSRVSVASFKEGPANMPVALKVLNKSTIIRLNQVEHVRTEKQILNGIMHPFVVNLLTTFQDKANLYMVLEYINGGELHSYIQVQAGQVTDGTARFFCGELFLALEYLHSLSVAHRDVKPSNILITSGGHLKLTDFGFAKVITDKSYTFVGTAEYVSPELVRRDPSEGHGLGVDWWAFGVVLFELLAGFTPFVAEDIQSIMDNILGGSVGYPRNMSSRAKALVAALLEPSVDHRLTPPNIRKHKWFRGMRFDRLIAMRLPPPFVPDVGGPEDTRMFDRYPDLGVPVMDITDEQQQHFQRFSRMSDGQHPTLLVKQCVYPEAVSSSIIEKLGYAKSFSSWGSSVSRLSTLSTSSNASGVGIAKQ